MADGRLNKCCECVKKSVKERTDVLKKDPLWLSKERERCRLKQNKRRLMGLEVVTQKYKLKWRARNKDKVKAQAMAYRFIKSKPDSCQKCGKKNCRLERHHEDYSKPLEIIWLCCDCHGKTRRKDEYFDIIP